ncbi:sugar transferase [bacterium]|nr:sugar transferase [bacterium]
MRLKRTVDLTVSITLLILFSLVMLITAVIILCFMGRPIMFCQQRTGLRSRLFVIYKFRTMINADDMHISDAQRLTRLGKLLRSTSLDELPQLLNVFKGDMSLVGPRPLLPEYLDRYTPRQARRHNVPPGMTGWAQVNGRNKLSWQQRFDLDIWYVDHQSLWLDMRILLTTIIKVLKRDGICSDGEATTSPFAGNYLGK